ncbi:MAG: OmpH family outer membrane protein [Deferribacteraceae bacterium]|jgi:outer membrane protein|nr:OmpH family outer membrane protein [Deferribacteraceae bacterium]
MRKKLGLIVALVVIMATMAVAQEMKVAVIDFAYCMRTSVAGKKATAEIQALSESKNASLKTLQDELKKMETDYTAKEKLLTDAAKREELQKFQVKAAEYEQKVRQAQAELQAKDQELTQKTLKALETVVNAYAREKGYTVVLQAQAVVYVGPTVVNISDDVIKRFDAGK